MKARQKLNLAFVYASVFLAGLGSLMADSWTVFLVGTAALLALGCYAGAIRLRGRRPRARGRSYRATVGSPAPSPLSR
jgi:hypothetical protein